MALISIVIPTNNRPHLFELALKSTLNQVNFDNYEIVVSANGNPTFTDNIVQRHNSDKIKFAKIGKFVDIWTSWEFAIEQATGDYVLLLGDDDSLMQDALYTYSTTLKLYQNPDYISPACCWYGHANVNHPRRNALRFDLEWNQEGYRNPKMLLKSFYAFGRPTFTPTYILFKREIISHVKELKKKLFHPVFPDYSLHIIALAFSNTAVVMKEPTIVHGYAEESGGEMVLKQNREEIKWPAPLGEDDVLRNSPLKSYIFVNGWLETLLRVKEAFPEQLNDIDVNWLNFYYRYCYELALDGKWRNITEEFINLSKAIRSNPEPIKKIILGNRDIQIWLEKLRLIIENKIWESVDFGLLNNWLPGEQYGFSNIVEGAIKAKEIYMQKVLNSNIMEHIDI